MVGVDAALRRVRGIRGVGFSKMTKALHPKRPALIPMVDSVVQETSGRRPRSPGSVRRARARARPRLQTRSGPQPGGAASGPEGARQAQPRAQRGANPRSADLVSSRRRRGVGSQRPEKGATVTQAPNEPPSFETQAIKPLFLRARPRVDAVPVRSLAPVRRREPNTPTPSSPVLQDGTMPCDSAWPQAQATSFKRWIETGKPS